MGGRLLSWFLERVFSTPERDARRGDRGAIAWLSGDEKMFPHLRKAKKKT